MSAICRAVAAAAGQEAFEPRRTAQPRVSRRQAIGGVAAVSLLGGGALVAWQQGVFDASGGGARSIAVLPFKNLSANADQAFLSDGLTDEVRSALTRNAALSVLAATSSNSVGEMKGDAVAIAGKLGVAYLLEGSVQRVGDMVRVAIDLTDGNTGFSTWSRRVASKLTDIFAFQSEIAGLVSSALSVRMATDDPAPGGTRNVGAYEAFLRGRALYNLSKDEASDREAMALFENAISADPKFALAHAARSRVLSSIASAYAPAAEIKPTFAAAIEEGRRAVELAPKLAEAHLALGYAMFAGQLDIKGARRSYDLAYRYGRGNADNLVLYAYYAVRARRSKEALAAIAQAVALDPLNPRTHRAAGTIAFATRDYDAAIDHYERALELNPAMANVHAFLGNSLTQLGKLDEARTALAKEPSAMFRLTGQAILERRAGNASAAAKAFDALVAEVGDAALYQQAQVMAQWRRPDQAIALLERARAVGDSGMTSVASDPFLDPIARDPRFRVLVRDMGFG